MLVDVDDSFFPQFVFYLFCNFTRDGKVTEGGYTFNLANSQHTKMYGEIPDI